MEPLGSTPALPLPYNLLSAESVWTGEGGIPNTGEKGWKAMGLGLGLKQGIWPLPRVCGFLLCRVQGIPNGLVLGYNCLGVAAVLQKEKASPHQLPTPCGNYRQET